MLKLAIIPAYNEASKIAAVVEKTRPFVDRVIVVNDGSADETALQALHAGASVVSHRVNRGLGASLCTGFAVARVLNADIAITLDADLQHDPAEIPGFIQAIASGADVVIGSRMMKGATGEMPLIRRIAQVCGNIVTYFLFGAWVSDSQSGYRALSRHALNTVQLRTNRMEISSEIVAETKQKGLKLKEIPIRSIYTDYSMAKGQSFFVGLKTAVKLLIRRIK